MKKYILSSVLINKMHKIVPKPQAAVPKPEPKTSVCVCGGGGMFMTESTNLFGTQVSQRIRQSREELFPNPHKMHAPRTHTLRASLTFLRFNHIHICDFFIFVFLYVFGPVQPQMKMKSAGVVDGGLFTESYCNICNAQLISESQRTAHYEVSPSEEAQKKK